MSDLSQIVKAYDVRGIVPDQLNEPVARALGTAFVEMLRESGDDADRIVIAHDMRDSAPALAAAFAAGANAAGAAVVHIGLGSTDQLYYASGVARPARGDVHRQPQPGAVQRHQAVPGRRPAGRPGQRSGRVRERAQAAARRSRRRSGRGARSGSSTATCSPTTPRTCAPWSTCPASGR